MIDPHGALQSANATVGVRLPVSLPAGIGLETKPTLIGSAAATANPATASLSPGIGFSVAEAISIELPRGIRLAAEGSVGDLLGIYGPAATAPAGGAPPLAVRAKATLSTDLTLPFVESRFHIGLGIATTGGLTLVGAGANHLYAPAACTLSLDFGRIGGAALNVSGPCSNEGIATTPISFGFKTIF
jgi:hypothetical protein